MLAKPDEQLHALARVIAETLKEPDKKQLRFNEIVETAKLFYTNHVDGGVIELVLACDKSDEALYDKTPMWKSLQENYKWMITHTKN